MQERFGKIMIDGPAAPGVSHDTAAVASVSDTSAPIAPPAFRSVFGLPMIPEITPRDDEHYRLLPLRRVLDLLGLPADSRLYTDDIGILRSRLYRRGLRLGCYIPGKTALPLDEEVPLYLERHGDMSTRGTPLVALFVIAWVLAADRVDDATIKLVDRWIESGEYSDSTDSHIPALATFRWLVRHKLVLTKSRKRRVASFARFHKRRHVLVSFLLSLMANPDISTPRRMQRLETIYALVGLSPSDIHSDMHRLGTAQHTRSSRKSAEPSSIDPAVLRAMSHDTAKAQQILAGVFDDASDVPDLSAPGATVSAADTAGDKAAAPAASPLTAVLEALSERPQWSRGEVDSLCREHGLTAGQALEQLNDMSYDMFDSAVAEDDGDTVYVDQSLTTDMLSQ